MPGLFRIAYKLLVNDKGKFAALIVGYKAGLASYLQVLVADQQRFSEGPWTCGTASRRRAGS
jgi:hypothetical protein